MTGAGAVAIGTMLENAMEELFVPYNEGAKYIEKECKTAGEMYAASLERFAKYHVSPLFLIRQRYADTTRYNAVQELAMRSKSTKLFDRLAQLTLSSTSGGSSTSTSSSATAAAAAAQQAQAAATAAFMNISGRIRGVGANTAGSLVAPPPLPEKDSSRTGGAGGGGGGTGVAQDLPTEEDGKLNIDVAEKFLSWHAEAVGRCVELSVPPDL